MGQDLPFGDRIRAIRADHLGHFQNVTIPVHSISGDFVGPIGFGHFNRRIVDRDSGNPGPIRRVDVMPEWRSGDIWGKLEEIGVVEEIVRFPLAEEPHEIERFWAGIDPNEPHKACARVEHVFRWALDGHKAHESL